VGKGWSVFFGVVLFGTLIIWFVAPVYGWWLPENISTFGSGIDNLFYLIFGFTGFFFVLTEMVLVYAMWKFAARPGEKAIYSHGNHRLEMLWTAVPAAILLFIAVAQITVWERIKYQKVMPPPDLTVSVLARQWEWRLRYPDDSSRFKYDDKDNKDKAARSRAARIWSENPEITDVQLPNALHCWKGANVKIYLRTQDVIHSFTLPNLRLKQDMLPGKNIPMWFNATKSNCRFVLRDRAGKEVELVFDEKMKPVGVKEGETVIPLSDKLGDLRGELIESEDDRDKWEIACQELCGGRHYAMRGRFYVHQDEASYAAWLEYTRYQQTARVAHKQ